ncbi:hypothetical protein HK101_008793 [Irineochytrium annulatum]|nr:hypothetical protein HK101_008793 [Irineochytrium annulatum]
MADALYTWGLLATGVFVGIPALLVIVFLITRRARIQLGPHHEPLGRSFRLILAHLLYNRQITQEILGVRIRKDAPPPEVITARAMALTRLDEFGIPSGPERLFNLGLKMALDDVWDGESESKEAGTYGRGLCRYLILDRALEDLAVRLRVVGYIANNPEVEEIDLPPIVIVTGVPNSGTPEIRKIFAKDARFYAPEDWELSCPAPTVTDVDEMEKNVGPRSASLPAPTHLVLESPYHLRHLHTLVQVFGPSITIVQVHRHPSDAVPVSLAQTSLLRRVLMTPPDTHRAVQDNRFGSRTALKRLSEALEEGMRQRDALETGGIKFVDIVGLEALRDPRGHLVRKVVVGALALPFTGAEEVKAMVEVGKEGLKRYEGFSASKARTKGGRAARLATLGVKEKDLVAGVFNEYAKRLDNEWADPRLNDTPRPVLLTLPRRAAAAMKSPMDLIPGAPKLHSKEAIKTILSGLDMALPVLSNLGLATTAVASVFSICQHIMQQCLTAVCNKEIALSLGYYCSRILRTLEAGPPARQGKNEHWDALLETLEEIRAYLDKEMGNKSKFMQFIKANEIKHRLDDYITELSLAAQFLNLDLTVQVVCGIEEIHHHLEMATMALEASGASGKRSVVEKLDYLADTVIGLQRQNELLLAMMQQGQVARVDGERSIVELKEYEDKVWRRATEIDRANSSGKADFKLKIEQWMISSMEVTFTEEAEDFINQGATSKVYRGLYRNQTVAVKLYTENNRGSRSLEAAMSEELEAWMRVSHLQYVLTLIGACTKVKRPFIVSKYCSEHDIVAYLERYPNKMILCLYQLACGLRNIHQERIVHRDVKASNVLITEQGDVAITDFGLSRKTTTTLSMGVNGKPLPSPSGTLNWMSPEQLMSPGKETFKSDVWSYAMTCWEILSGGRIPFDGFHLGALERAVGGDDERPNRPAAIRDKRFDAFWDILKRCWRYDPMMRPSAAEVVRFFEDRHKADLEAGRSLIEEYHSGHQMEAQDPFRKGKGGLRGMDTFKEQRNTVKQDSWASQPALVDSWSDLTVEAESLEAFTKSKVTEALRGPDTFMERGNAIFERRKEEMERSRALRLMNEGNADASARGLPKKAAKDTTAVEKPLAKTANTDKRGVRPASSKRADNKELPKTNLKGGSEAVDDKRFASQRPASRALEATSRNADAREARRILGSGDELNALPVHRKQASDEPASLSESKGRRLSLDDTARRKTTDAMKHRSAGPMILETQPVVAAQASAPRDAKRPASRDIKRTTEANPPLDASKILPDSIQRQPQPAAKPKTAEAPLHKRATSDPTRVPPSRDMPPSDRSQSSTSGRRRSKTDAPDPEARMYLLPAPTRLGVIPASTSSSNASTASATASEARRHPAWLDSMPGMRLLEASGASWDDRLPVQGRRASVRGGASQLESTSSDGRRRREVNPGDGLGELEDEILSGAGGTGRCGDGAALVAAFPDWCREKRVTVDNWEMAAGVEGNEGRAGVRINSKGRISEVYVVWRVMCGA